MIYFAHLDTAIRSASQGKRTLLTALRPLFERRLKVQPITMLMWEGWLRAEQGEDEVALFAARC